LPRQGTAKQARVAKVTRGDTAGGGFDATSLLPYPHKKDSANPKTAWTSQSQQSASSVPLGRPNKPLNGACVVAAAPSLVSGGNQSTPLKGGTSSASRGGRLSVGKTNNSFVVVYTSS
jgi:hypothetical protein